MFLYASIFLWNGLYSFEVNNTSWPLKVENILFYEKLSLLKIIDFGVAIFINSETESITCIDPSKTGCHTTTNGDFYKQIVGSPPYLAPELIIGSTPYSTPVDVYAGGVIFFALLCRLHPAEIFTQTNQFEAIHQLFQLYGHAHVVKVSQIRIDIDLVVISIRPFIIISLYIITISVSYYYYLIIHYDYW